MKKTNLILVTVFMLCACTNDDVTLDNGKKSSGGGIYGVVTDFATGEPVQNANVQLRPSGETTLTGSDGSYEFIDLETGDYSITVSKAEYTDLIDDYVISVTPNRKMRRDVQIKKIAATLEVIDNNGQPLSELDFGTNVDTKQFGIFNSRTVTISCEIIAGSSGWVSIITNQNPTIKSGDTYPVVVEIDRSKLKAGENVSYVHVISNNGNKEIRVKAFREHEKPQVTTLSVTDKYGNYSAWGSVFRAEVTDVGTPAYTKRGFCLSVTNKTPTIQNTSFEVAGTGLGQYEYTHWYFEPETATYYVRAWIEWEGTIVYGNVVSFIYNYIQ